MKSAQTEVPRYGEPGVVLRVSSGSVRRKTAATLCDTRTAHSTFIGKPPANSDARHEYRLGPGRELRRIELDDLVLSQPLAMEGVLGQHIVELLA